MALFFTEFNRSILLAIFMAYDLWKHLLWGMAGERDSLCSTNA